MDAPRSGSLPGVLVAAATLLAACGGDGGGQADPTAGPAGPDVPYASPCDAVDDADVAAVLGGPPRVQAELGPTDVYPEGLAGYAAGAAPGRYVCIYQGEAGAEVSVAVTEPDRGEFDQGRTAGGESGCAYAPTSPLGGESYTLRCTPAAEPPIVYYVLLTRSSLLQCLGSGAGIDVATLEPQAERVCTGVVDRLTA